MHALQPFLAPICLVLTVAVIVQFVLLAGVNRRFDKLLRSLRTFFSTAGGEDIENLLRQTLELSRDAVERCDENVGRINQLEEALRGCQQYMGMVRYDAFGDATGQQSFSLAVLDQKDNGFVLSALFGRSNSRCYGKHIVGGQAQQALTAEEQQALLQALEQKVGHSK